MCPNVWLAQNRARESAEEQGRGSHVGDEAGKGGKDTRATSEGAVTSWRVPLCSAMVMVGGSSVVVAASARTPPAHVRTIFRSRRIPLDSQMKTYFSEPEKRAGVRKQAALSGGARSFGSVICAFLCRM